ncbi:hypothetical protein ACOI1C_13585 [Bacillus sp. DJP31]|uniref:hypothetical protein n=1 Tax=Bacillus sp. DJP31 TaxID=3409789 RepID=UPI003BB7263F
MAASSSNKMRSASCFASKRATKSVVRVVFASANDMQSQSDYYKKLAQVERRMNYTDGLHVGSTYTTIAHLWFIKQLVRAFEWRFVTVEYNSLMTSINRVFSKEIRLSNVQHFLCQTDKTKTRKEVRKEFL